ncbi:MAG: tetratricopeptide repeat protein, partial [Myxococcales bacterium]|nr:tetratricopeptide repeat protein [Myxococcales bacterium]
REERAVLERYVPRTLQRAYRGMVRRYGYTPPAPLRFELYANNEHFSVRTAGLPNVGVQGVCFGRLVTAISPRGGPFSWGQITWHELAHVFHLGISRNRVPRWFTEGLAEYEAGLGSDHWRREMDHILLRFLESDRLPALSQMNRAFTRARSGEDVMAAYYASSRIVQHIAEVHGFEKLVRMLELWGEGRSSAEVIQQALGLSLDALDTEFREASRRRLSGRAADFGVDFSRYYELEPFRAAAAAHLSDAARQADLAAALLAHGEAEQAATQATRALELDPEHPIARFVLARIALGSEDHAGARIHLDKLVANGADGYEVRLMRARLAMAASDSAAARAELEAAARIDPDRPEAHLGRLELAGPDPAARLPIVERLAEIDEHSRELNAELLGLLEGLGRWEELVRHGERALYIDPHRSETHRALAEAYLHVDRAADALYEADSALLASPEAAAPLHLLRARALQALGRGRAAREAAQQALQADPSLAEAARALGAR